MEVIVTLVSGLVYFGEKWSIREGGKRMRAYNYEEFDQFCFGIAYVQLQLAG